MNFEEFKASIPGANPPQGANALLQAMWFEAKGNWEMAHNIAQDVNSDDGSWVHAYLHRKEGDIDNASYWYSRAGKSKPQVSLDEEWEVMVKEFLKD
ncbi:hypothetical protein BH23BAC1_BH23BAC1_35540 [soil metagenome]